MKTISKLFMAVVAGVLAFSCVTDTTDDLGVNLGEGQSTTLTLSLDESRTHLGVRDEDGKEYPLYWSKGDQIAVNGEASDALGEEYHGQAQATFKFTGTLLNYPYNIVYPAPAEGVKAVTAGQQVVTFKTSQAYTAGSFAEGSVPMYGYVEDENDATTLNHLAGVLRIDVKGNGEVLKALVVEVEKGKISGNFDVDCANGTLTAHTDATNTVTVSFGDDLALSTTATPIYVAVPAGEYGVVKITLYTDKGYCDATFDTTGKAIAAGVVREFPAFEYKNEANDTFLIYDEASLRNFASRVNAAEANFDNTYPNARVVADIELTEPWVSINGYTGTFDGGNYSISNLDAPLFNTTQAAAIKNVHLTGVEITTSSLTKLGAIACYVDNADAEITNCSAEGTLTTTGTTIGKNAECRVGGIIGDTTTAKTVSDLVNKVNINFFSNGVGYIGGCIGGNSSKLTLTRCQNLGTIYYKNASTANGTLFIGGVCAHTVGATYCTNGRAALVGEDTAKVKEIGKVIYEGADNGIVNICGVTAIHDDDTISDCTNYANIIIAGSHSGGANFGAGGVTAYPNWSRDRLIITKCINHGDITISAQVTVTGDYLINFGGVIGGNSTASPATASYCENHGNINITENAKLSSEGTIYIGGVLARTYFKGTTDLTGSKNCGNITIAEGVAQVANTHIGGVAGACYKYTSTNVRCYGDISAPSYTNVGMFTGSAYNGATDCHVGGSIRKGDMTAAQPLSLENYTTYIYGSGVELDSDTEKEVVNSNRCGWLSENIDSHVQYKTIAGVKIGSEADFLAWAATAADSSESVVLTADIDLSKVTDWSALGDGVTAWKPIENFKGIFDGGNNFHINGLTAPLFGTTQAVEIKNVHLTGVDITSNLNPLGALACKVDNTAAVIQDCSADGTLTFTESSLAGSKQPYVGGLFGQIGSTNGDKNSVSGLVNSVDVNFKHNSACYLAGCVAVAYTSGIDNCTNLGTITFHEGYSASQTIWIAGICGQNFASDITNCTNGSWDEEKKEPTQEGKIVFNGTQSSSKFLMVSGVVCGINYKDTYCSLRDCTNYAPIEVNGSNASSGENPIFVSGLYSGPTYQRTLSEIANCYNYGDITVNVERTGTVAMYVGGICGAYIRCRLRNVENHGNIDVTNIKESNGPSHIAGIQATNFIHVGEQYASTFENIKNTGNITVDINNTSTEPFTNIEVSGIANSNSYINHSFNNARCYCNIKAIGIANVGMITGGARNATHPATNCHVGGSICTSMTGEGEAERPNEIELSAGNYFNYIYGSADWTGVEGYDGCKYISAIDAEPAN